MFKSIERFASLHRVVGLVTDWVARSLRPESATASHEVAGQQQMGPLTSSLVSYGYWPDSARYPG